MNTMVSQITSVSIVFSTISGADQRKHQSFASLAFVGGIHRWQVNSPHKGLVTRKMFPFDDVIMFIPCTGSEHTGKEVLITIREYIRHFFMCRECRDHFLEMSANLKNEVRDLGH